ncbi:MAG: restriction endonuclease subunit S, partial [Desulfamplus sp.]|nr:restriction endonuclease subunit S [Desulfamplus sp.]
QFNKIVSVIDQQIEILIKNNEILTTTRDRLLSRLMSGKIDVENLDILSPKSMMDANDA